jgi:hypothetical protein
MLKVKLRSEVEGLALYEHVASEIRRAIAHSVRVSHCRRELAERFRPWEPSANPPSVSGCVMAQIPGKQGYLAVGVGRVTVADGVDSPSLRESWKT